MIIRYGTISDTAKVARLWVKMVQESTGNLEPNVQYWKKLYNDRITEEDFVVLVAEEGGKIVGFVYFFAYDNMETGKRHGNAPYMYVEPEYRETDVSSKLYAGILKEANKRDCKTYEFYCNKDKIDFWSKKGYGIYKYLMSKEV
jgi:GNAT superfamily N-acetyltransferase